MSKLTRISVISLCCLLIGIMIVGLSTAVFYYAPRRCDTKDVTFNCTTTVKNNTATVYLSINKPYNYSTFKYTEREQASGSVYAYLFIYGTYADRQVASCDEDGSFTLEIPLGEDVTRLILQGEDSKKTIWIKGN